MEQEIQMSFEAAKVIAAGLALLPIFGVALGLGKFFASYNDAISRNPSSAEILDKKFPIAFALIEALGIFCLVVSLLIFFK